MELALRAPGMSTVTSLHRLSALQQEIARWARGIAEAVAELVPPQKENEVCRRREQELIGAVKCGDKGYFM